MKTKASIRVPRSYFRFIALVVIGLCLGSASSALAGIRRIWAVGDGEKIEWDDRTNPLALANPFWDGNRISLFGARNKILAFQLIVESDRSAINGLSVAFPSLEDEMTGSRIEYHPPGADPTDYMGRDIQIFTLNYMQVTRATQTGWMYEIGQGAPSDPTGWKPVQLVPENARSNRGGFPIRIEANRSQSIWIEIYTGRDRPAGTYSGSIYITADSIEYTVPISLHLWNFNLPEQNSMGAMINFESEQPLDRSQSHRLGLLQA